jgi:hypothetical protein
LVLPAEVVPLVVPMDELMRSEPVSSAVSDVALEISDALGESLSVICDCKGNPNSIDEQLFSQYLVRVNPK